MRPSTINELQQYVITVFQVAASQLADVPLDDLFRGREVIVVRVIPDGRLICGDDASCLLEVPE
jgi:hypothetical protein